MDCTDSFRTLPTPHARDSSATSTLALAQLCELWKMERHSRAPLSAEEENSLVAIFSDTIPAESVNLVSVERVHQPRLLHRFCAEESASLAGERSHKRTHKEIMLLHGTKWATVPLIRTNGLDPDTGHLTRGSWLGQNALAVHTYAAKGPGPEQEDGSLLFAMFVVACVVNQQEGDEERSFGIWRMMSSRRMYPAYLLLYSAPLDIRTKRPFPSPRINRSFEVLLRQRSKESIEQSAVGAVIPRPSRQQVQPSCPSSFPRPHSRQTRPPSPIASPRSSSPQPLSKQMRPSIPGASSNIQPRHTEWNSDIVRTKAKKDNLGSKAGVSDWELQLDDRWAAFCPGVPYKDEPGVTQYLHCGRFCYNLEFDVSGETGKQTNLSTGKVRTLRRVQSLLQASPRIFKKIPGRSRDMCSSARSSFSSGASTAASSLTDTSVETPPPSEPPAAWESPPSQSCQVMGAPDDSDFSHTGPEMPSGGEPTSAACASVECGLLPDDSSSDTGAAASIFDSQVHSRTDTVSTDSTDRYWAKVSAPCDCVNPAVQRTSLLLAIGREMREISQLLRTRLELVGTRSGIVSDFGS